MNLILAGQSVPIIAIIYQTQKEVCILELLFQNETSYDDGFEKLYYDTLLENDTPAFKAVKRYQLWGIGFLLVSVLALSQAPHLRSWSLGAAGMCALVFGIIFIYFAKDFYKRSFVRKLRKSKQSCLCGKKMTFQITPSTLTQITPEETTVVDWSGIKSWTLIENYYFLEHGSRYMALGKNNFTIGSAEHFQIFLDNKFRKEKLNLKQCSCSQ
ncbi:MAG: hypothetical protein RHS_2600 [Robinsoniella sp. RHS]|nr:MAG: hypothetical protein RHS_2600 [Robinsoniella sp. RHS]